MGFKLAELFVEIGAKTSPLQTKLAGVQRQLNTMAATPVMVGGVGGMGLGALAGITGAIAAASGIAFGIKKAVDVSSDLNEAINKTKVLLGESSAEIFKFADAMQKKYGAARREIIDASGNLAMLGLSTGMDKGKAAAFAVELSEATDAATSLINPAGGLAEMFERVQSGLSGQIEPLRKYGIFLSETAVEQQALSMGFRKVDGDIDQQGKTMARAMLILKGFKVAEGDHKNTQYEYANQMRELSGRWEELMIKIGDAFRPLATKIVMGLNTVLTGLTRLAENWGAIWLGMKSAAFGVVLNIGARLKWLCDVFVQFGQWLASEWVNLLVDAFNSAGVAMRNWAQQAVDILKALLAFRGGEFNVEWTKPIPMPELNTKAFKVPEFKAIFDDPMRPLKDAIGKALSPAGEADKKGKKWYEKGAMDESKKGKEKPEFMGAVEFVKKLQTSLFGDDHAKKTAENTEAIRKGIDMQNELIRKQGQPPALAAGPA